MVQLAPCVYLWHQGHEPQGREGPPSPRGWSTWPSWRDPFEATSPGPRRGHKDLTFTSERSRSNLADFVKVVEVAAHEEGRRRHDEVQHLARQDGHERVLPLQRVQVGQEALGHQRQQSPAGGEEHDPLLREEARQDLGKPTTPCTRLRPCSKH